MKKDNLAMKIWRIIYPPAIYLIVQNITAIIGMCFLMIQASFSFSRAGVSPTPDEVMNKVMDLYMEKAMIYLIISAVICIPIYYLLFKNDKKRNHEIKRVVPMGGKDVFVIILSSAALGLALNNMITLTPLPDIFPGYEDTNEMLYGADLVFQILGAGILACVVEEFLMRGLVYKRLRYYCGIGWAMFLSALIFGVYHMNVVQGVYAFGLGLYFAYLMERYDSLKASVIAHMSANLFVILMSASPGFDLIYTNLISFCLITCGAIVIFYYALHWMKETDPLVDLEFVEKEPDTLWGLSEEYKEQKTEDDSENPEEP